MSKQHVNPRTISHRIVLNKQKVKKKKRVRVRYGFLIFEISNIIIYSFFLPFDLFLITQNQY